MTPELFIAAPCYGGGMQTSFAQSMLELRELLVTKRVNHNIRFLAGESLIDRARNNLASDFLKTTGTHMMFIDADIDFDPEDVVKLLVQSETYGYDILGGAYATKRIDWDLVASLARSEPSITGEKLMKRATRAAIDFLPGTKGVLETETGCVEVRHIATGFMMIRRRVFEQLAMARPDLMYLNDHPGECYGEPVFDFFEVRRGNHGWDKTAPHLGRKLSEDYGFCDLWRGIGGKVWLNLDVQLGHTGQMRFQGEAASPKMPEVDGTVRTEWYDLTENMDDPATEKILNRYEWATTFVKNCNVANAACASNYGALILEGAGNRVTGFDIDPVAIATAERDGLVPAVLADITTLDLGGFDALVSLETLEHLERPFEWLQGLSSSVAKLVTSVPIVPTMHNNRFHRHDFTEATFLDGLQGAGWKVRETWLQNDDVLMVYSERS